MWYHVCHMIHVAPGFGTYICMLEDYTDNSTVLGLHRCLTQHAHRRTAVGHGRWLTTTQGVLPHRPTRRN